MKNELLAKYILGEVNMKEGQRVEQWLEESEDHQREFRQRLHPKIHRPRARRAEKAWRV